MKIIFEEKDIEALKQMIKNYGSNAEPEDFIKHLNSIADVEMASIVGEFEWWDQRIK